MAEYGKMGSKEELAKSGYILPDSHFVTPAPDGSGEASADEKAQLDAMKAESKDETAPVIENKVVTPQKAPRKGKK